VSIRGLHVAEHFQRPGEFKVQPPGIKVDTAPDRVVEGCRDDEAAFERRSCRAAVSAMALFKKGTGTFSERDRHPGMGMLSAGGIRVFEADSVRRTGYAFGRKEHLHMQTHKICRLRNISILGTAFALLALSSAASPAHAGDIKQDICTPCAADLDGDGTVDGADLGVLLQAWGKCPPGTPCDADLNGDGVVDGADLGILLAAWGNCPGFVYPTPENPEGYQIALELLGAGGPLLPADALVERVVRDIELIREYTPLLSDQIHTPAFQWDFLILSRDHAADSASYECLNDYYQASLWAELEILQMTILQFPGPINTPALAQIYAQSEHVNWAEASAIYGGENFWIPTPFGGLDGTWSWFVDDGFHDCFDGCDCHYYYWFTVSGDGVVTLIDYQEVGPWYCPWPH